MSPETKRDYSTISHTALLVAYHRGLTDIPYAKEIAEACEAEKTLQEKTGGKIADLHYAAPLIEMRYKAVDKLLGQLGVQQVLELAAGVSPRGFIMTKLPYVVYVATDLPDMVLHHKSLVQKINDYSQSYNSSLTSVPLDATDPNDFKTIKGLFNNRPIYVTCEGFLPYLSHDEKRIVGRNIQEFLRQRGGAWITVDIHLRGEVGRLVDTNRTQQNLRKDIERTSHTDFEANCFDDLNHAREFFHGLGFSNIREYQQKNLVPELSCLDRITIDPAVLTRIRNMARVWVMAP